MSVFALEGLMYMCDQGRLSVRKKVAVGRARVLQPGSSWLTAVSLNVVGE